MLSKILSITGRPGLYKLISTNKNLNIVESLADRKRIPVYAQEKVVALSDVSIYTTDGDAPLRSVLKKIKEKEGGEKLSLGTKSSGKELFAYLEEILPDYSRESVYASDVKKMITWYNILVENDIDLDEEEKEVTDEEEKEVTEEEEKEVTEEEGKENPQTPEDITEKSSDN
ncbi:MAG: DUF5606 domain-containing protein [Proteiniphilum sp.]